MTGIGQLRAPAGVADRAGPDLREGREELGPVPQLAGTILMAAEMACGAPRRCARAARW